MEKQLAKFKKMMENQVAKSKNILEKQVAKQIKFKNMVAKLENCKNLKSGKVEKILSGKIEKN